MSKPVNSCVLKNLFGGSSAIKKSPKNSGNALFDSSVMSGFQNLTAVKLKPRILVNSLIHYLINLRPKVQPSPTVTCSINNKKIDVHCDVKQVVKWKMFRHVTECNTNKYNTMNVSVFQILGGGLGL